MAKNSVVGSTYDDSIRSDAEKLVKVFDSCKTDGQYCIALKMLELFEIKYNIGFFTKSASEAYYIEMINDSRYHARGRTIIPIY